MENPEIPTSTHSELAELQARYDSLRQTVVSLLVLVIVVSGCFNLYLLRQVNYSRKDLEVVRQQAAPIITDYQTNSGPAMDKFLRQLADYGREHPDFRPIIEKYGIDKPAATATGTPPAVTTPAPQKAGAQKK